HSGGHSRPHLRPVLHDEAGRPGHGSRARHRAAPRPAQRWIDRSRVGARADRVPCDAADGRRGEPRKPGVNKPVLLVVDDDPQVLAAVRRDLRSRYRDQYTVVSAASGPEALAAAKELKSRGDALAMVISDQRMPGMLGGELLAKSREVYPLARRV